MDPQLYTSSLLTRHPIIGHGFFGYTGGVSDGPYGGAQGHSSGGLNASPYVGDVASHVTENRTRICDVLTLPASRLITLTQEHGTTIHTLPTVPLAVDRDPLPPGDGLITTQVHMGLGILSADCAPVLWADPINGVIGACHGGWKGVMDNIMDHMLAAMLKAGASQDHLHVAIGPTIHKDSYAVGGEFKEQFTDRHSQSIPYFHTHEDRLFFDLPGFIENTLLTLGVRRLDRMPLDTFTGPFFSYRRAMTQTQSPVCGRNVSVIFLRP